MGGNQYVAPGVAEYKGRRRHKTRRIEPPFDGALRTGKVAVANPIWPLEVGGVEIVGCHLGVKRVSAEQATARMNARGNALRKKLSFIETAPFPNRLSGEPRRGQASEADTRGLAAVGRR